MGFPSTGTVVDAGTMELNQRIRELSENWGRLTGQIGRTGHELTRARAGINRTGKAFFTLSNLITPTTLALMGMGYALGSSINRFKEFEKNITNAGTVTGLFGEALQKVKKQMSETAMTLGRGLYNATEVSNAFYQLNSAGLAITESTRMMRAVLNFATATLSDTAQSAEVLTAAMRAFNLTADDASKIADVFAKAIGSSPLTISRLQESLKYAAPVAAAMGRSIAEVSAALGVMAKRGFYGSIAGTALRNVYVRLSRRTSDVSNALKRLGLTYADVNPATHSLAEIVQTLHDRSAGLADIMDIMGVRAGPAFLAIMQEGSKGLQEFTTEMETARGQAQRMADEQLNTLYGQMKKITSQISNMSVALGDKFVKTIRNMGPIVITGGASLAMFGGVLSTIIMTTMAGGIPLMGSFVRGIRKLTTGAQMAAAAFRILWIQKTTDLITTRKLTFETNALTYGITGLNTASLKAAFSITALKAALSSLGGVMAIVSAALLIGGYLWMQNQKKIQKHKEALQEEELALSETLAKMQEIHSMEEALRKRDEFQKMIDERIEKLKDAARSLRRHPLFGRGTLKADVESLQRQIKMIADTAKDAGFNVAEGFKVITQAAAEARWSIEDFQTSVNNMQETATSFLDKAQMFTKMGFDWSTTIKLISGDVEEMYAQIKEWSDQQDISTDVMAKRWAFIIKMLHETEKAVRGQQGDVEGLISAWREWLDPDFIKTFIKMDDKTAKTVMDNWSQVIDNLTGKLSEASTKTGVWFWTKYRDLTDTISKTQELFAKEPDLSKVRIREKYADLAKVYEDKLITPLVEIEHQAIDTTVALEGVIEAVGKVDLTRISKYAQAYTSPTVTISSPFGAGVLTLPSWPGQPMNVVNNITINNPTGDISEIKKAVEKGIIDGITNAGESKYTPEGERIPGGRP